MFTKQQEKIRQFIFDRPDYILMRPINDILEKIDVGYSTFYGTIRKMGFDNFKSLRDSLIKSSVKNNAHVIPAEETDILKSWKMILNENNNIMKGKKTNELVKWLLDADKIMIYGRGDSRIAGEQWSLRLHELGLNIYHQPNDEYINEIMITKMTSKSIIIFLSLLGQKSNVPNNFFKYIKNNKKVRTISISSNSNSFISINSDLSILVASTRLQTDKNKWILTSIPYFYLLDVISQKILDKKTSNEVNEELIVF